MPGWVRLLAPLILLLLSGLFLLLATRSTAALWGLAITIPLLAIAVVDLVQKQHSLRRNYPLVGRFRWLFEDLRPYLRSYIVESNLDGRPFDRNARALVYARSKNQMSTHPFGTELDVYSDEYEWLSHSMAPNDSVSKEFRIAIGGPQCAQPYSAAILNISAMSFGSLGHRAIEALNIGAKRGNFYHDTGEGSFSRYHAKHGGDIVWELGSGYFGCRDVDGHFDSEKFRETATRDQIRMIEIKLSQGAKPGQGGLLPGAKVTPEIAEARGIPAGKDCLSPPGHSAFSTPLELLAWAARLRDLSGGKPVGIKLCVGQPHEVFAIVKAMLESDILLDFIVVDGAEGGTGAAPVEMSNRVGMPLREGLILVRNALVGAGLKEHVALGAAGKVVSGAGLAINLALGADWCNAARAFMFSLGCVQSMKCHTDNCPTGVATQDEFRQRALVIDDKAERVHQFQKQTVAALRDIVVAMGLESPWQIRPHHLHERLNAAKSSSIDHIYPFLEKGALLDAPGDTPYAHYWAAAQTGSFRAAPAVKQTQYEQGTRM